MKSNAMKTVIGYQFWDLENSRVVLRRLSTDKWNMFKFKDTVRHNQNCTVKGLADNKMCAR